MQIIHFDIRPGFVYLDEHRYVIKVLGMYCCTYVSDIDMSDLPVSEVLICFPQNSSGPPCVPASYVRCTVTALSVIRCAAMTSAGLTWQPQFRQ